MKSSRGGSDARIVAGLKERVNWFATATRTIPVIGFGSKQGALTGTPRRRLPATTFSFLFPILVFHFVQKTAKETVKRILWLICCFCFRGVAAVAVFCGTHRHYWDKLP